jgi:D-amino peptidase
MKVLVSVDIEGVAGVVDSDETHPGRPEYEWARRLMAAEANAAVGGILSARPDALVTVADGHGTYRNLLPELIDRRARLVRGKPRPLAMMEGVDQGVDAALFIGYHGRAGSAPSVLAHTFGDGIADVRVNGVSVGEIGLNAVLAGHFGVPVLLVTGDESVRSEVAELLPDTAAVVVKRPIGFAAADSLSPEEAQRLIAEAAAEAVARSDAVAPFLVEAPVEVEIDLASPATVDRVATVPGLTLEQPQTCAYRADDALEAFRVVRTVVALT